MDSAAALAGKRVALMARSVIISTFDLQCEYVEYNTNTDILEAVRKRGGGLRDLPRRGFGKDHGKEQAGSDPGRYDHEEFSGDGQ